MWGQFSRENGRGGLASSKETEYSKGQQLPSSARMSLALVSSQETLRSTMVLCMVVEERIFPPCSCRLQPRGSAQHLNWKLLVVAKSWS